MLKKLFCLRIWEGNARGRGRARVAEVSQPRWTRMGKADASLRWQALGARREWGRGQAVPKEYRHGENIERIQE